MKRSTISLSAISALVMFSFMMSSFMPQSGISSSKSINIDRATPISIVGLGNPLLTQGSTYFGTVIISGAFNAVGTYEMPTQSLGMALHCTFYLHLPDGTITIRMNCNMVTFNGVWKILEGTGAYSNLKGEGSLVMPNDDDEILNGSVRGF